MLNCAILDDYQDVALSSADWGRLEGVRVRRFGDHLDDRALLAERLEAFEIIVAMRERTPFDEALFSLLPNLKLLVTTGMRNASIDLGAATRHGVMVCGTESLVGSAAELAWALLMALMRNLPEEVANFRSGGPKWQLSLGTDLMGRTLGVVGLGKLGQRVAGYGKAFGMEVIGWSKRNSPERCADLGIGYAASLDDLLSRADVVSLHVTLNDETRSMIGDRELGLMKPEAVIVNTARGPVIEEEALIKALRQGRITGAALDVFDREPLPADHPFRTLPNVVATPHLGYVTQGTYAIYFADAVEAIEAWMAGRPVRVLNGE